jgi:hypothetical protein
MNKVKVRFIYVNYVTLIILLTLLRKRFYLT